MEIARRGLLGLGAAAAVSALASACRGPFESGTPTSEAPPGERSRSPTGPTKRVSARFFGHPPPGNLYYGACLPDDRSLPTWEKGLGAHLAVNRSYFTFTPGVNREIAARCRDDLANDRLPHVSVKPPGTWRDIASGERDPWLSDLLRALGQEPGPVFLTVHHEPENDAGGPGLLPADYVSMQRHTMGMAADLAPKVTVIPVLQHWTFDPVRDDINPREWLVPGAAVFGVDIYNPWSLTNGREWRTFSSLAEEVRRWIGDAPLAIGEYGCRADPSHPGLASQWLRDAAEYARTNNVVSMSYFNSHIGADDGSWVMRGDEEQTFSELLASDWVFRPDLVGTT